MAERKITITLKDENDDLIEIEYEDGTKMQTNALFLLVDHTPMMRFVQHGPAVKVARLLFGSYQIALQKAGEGSIQDAYYAEMLEKVCHDVVKVVEMSRSRLKPEEVMEKFGGGGGSEQSH